jgi:hypothetical protein
LVIAAGRPSASEDATLADEDPGSGSSSAPTRTTESLDSADQVTRSHW